MKILKFPIIGLFFVAAFALNSFGQEKPPAKNSKYNKALAQKLGGDKNGMKQYIFVFLKRGQTKFEDKERAALLKGHMETIDRLAKYGKLVLAGPFGDDKDVRGIYIFDVRSVEEAQKLVESDPSIKAGLFQVEMRPWWGTAALLEIVRIHDEIIEEK